MKAYIKGGLFLALGWLANHADGQEIQFRASTPKTTNPVVIAPPSEAVGSGANVRAVSLSQPAPLESPNADGAGTPQFRPIARGQKADDITVSAIPKLEVGGKEGQPKPLPKPQGFTPPPPTPETPSPVFGGLGMTPDGCFDGAACPPGGRSRWFSDSSCCPERRQFWISGEYLMWWQRSQSVPPLITGSLPNTAVADAAVIGAPNTVVLYDSSPLTTRGGGRFTMGTWLPHFCNRVGIEASYFFLSRSNSTSNFASDGSAILGRPFIDGGMNNAELFSFPGLASGSASVSNFSQLWGFEGNVRYKWHCGPRHWIDVLGGYRYLNLNEGISIREDVTFGPNTGAPGLRAVEDESFTTRNQFNGAQFGLDGECRVWNRWFLGWSTKVALGNVRQTVNITGTTTFTNVPAPFVDSVQQGALLASPTNIGSYSQNRFAVLPEVSLKFGYDITDNLRIFAGYNFLYLSSVVRPAEQIDLNFNQSFTPNLAGPGPGVGPRVPAVLFRTNDYWAQGLTFGLQYRY